MWKKINVRFVKLNLNFFFQRRWSTLVWTEKDFSPDKDKMKHFDFSVLMFIMEDFILIVDSNSEIVNFFPSLSFIFFFFIEHILKQDLVWLCWLKKSRTGFWFSKPKMFAANLTINKTTNKDLTLLYLRCISTTDDLFFWCLRTSFNKRLLKFPFF